MFLRLVFILCLVLGTLSKEDLNFTSTAKEPVVKQNQSPVNPNPTAHVATKERVSFKSITRDYMKANIKLQKEFNATTNRLLINYPVQKYPNYQDDGWKVYYINYYVIRYFYLKFKYVQAEKDYKEEIVNFEVDAKEKAEDGATQSPRRHQKPCQQPSHHR
ncbi:hypothetical protein DSO57_1036230 [Entomophthora muscae]|uniref:Uncharacterized protein n=1 Tax=Entomophthora muscae TaxID=34485 RepID=A0ACC2SP19_9FUNG|nr:hypothetical protein DSO57_1036230 [Entomophthora muscae]